MIPSSDIDNEQDLIQEENDFIESLEELDIDAMSEEFITKTPQQIAKDMADKQLKAKREKEKEREEKRKAVELERRTAHLNNDDAYKCYSELMDLFPKFEPPASSPAMHWSSNLVRILNIINYKHAIEVLANPASIVGDPETISRISIVKSHLNRATFDHIWAQMESFMSLNPDFEIEGNLEVQKSMSYVSEKKFEFDESSDSSADPRFGAW